MVEGDVLVIIREALELDSTVSMLDVDNDNVDTWDSLAHLNIIQQLDRAFDGKVAELDKMAEVNSVKGILEILRQNDLLD